MSSIQDLMTAIAQMEGYNTPGTIAQRNNNPGNLRYAPNQIGSEDTVNGTFATFATPQDGWDALQSYIQNKQSSGSTVRDFVYTYAPPKENDTTNYLNFISSKIGLGADSLLSSLGVSNATDSGSDTGSDSSILSDLSIDPSAGGNVAIVVGIGLAVGLLVSKVLG